MVTCYADQDGTITVQFSDDNINFYTVSSRRYRAGGVNRPTVLVCAARYYKVSFENTSASNQTALRLFTYQGMFNKLTAPSNGIIARDADALVTINVNEKLYRARGDYDGVANFSKFGYNEDLDNGVAETLWAAGGTWTRMASADTLDVVSSSGNDTNSSGSGARQVLITGVDENGITQTETVNLSGVTPVTTSGSWLGVNRVAVSSAGATTYNEGNITISATGAATTQAYVPAGDSITQQLIFTVPSDKDSYITRLLLEGSKTTGGASPKITIKAYQLLGGIRYELLESILDVSINAKLEARLENPVKIAAGSQWWVEATSNTNDTFLRGRIEQTLIDTDV